MPDRNRNNPAGDLEARKIVGEFEWDDGDEFGRGQPSRPIRHLPDGGGVVEITTRTLQGRFLMKPAQSANELIAGVIGRALELHPRVELYGYWFLSNHYNLLAGFPDVETMCAFMTFVNSNLARELGALYDWKEKFWGRRYRAILVVDEEAEVNRLAYLLAQGTKEGLVARPREWPGLKCLETLVTGKPVMGRWINRTGIYNARRGGKRVSEEDFVTYYPIRIAPLPAWKQLREAERRERTLALLAAIERRGADECKRRGRAPMGAKRILAQNPHDHPASIARSPAPMCHASSRKGFWKYANAYFSFLAEYRELSDRVLEGDLSALDEFPRRCFRPAPPPIVRAARRRRRQRQPSA